MFDCCESMKGMVRDVNEGEYSNIMIKFNVDAEEYGEKQFKLAFTHKSRYGQSWIYMDYCPFCSKEL